MGEPASFTTYTLTRDGERDLRFGGVLLAEASSHSDDGGRSSRRWTELELYRAEHGAYVVAIIGRTIWEGERDHHAAHVCDSEAAVEAAVVDVLEADNDGRLGWLAKKLLSRGRHRRHGERPH